VTRLVSKPWGHEEIWAETDAYVGKRLVISAGERLSLQYHEEKHETILVVSGVLRLVHGWEVGELETTELGAGEVFDIPPGLIHRFEAPEDVELMEVSTPQLDDVVRLSDDYGRAEE